MGFSKKGAASGALSHGQIGLEATVTPKESHKFISLPGALWMRKLRAMLQHSDSGD